MTYRNLFLTGEIGVGKSTAVDAAVAQLGLTPGGFRTRFDDKLAADRRLCLFPISGADARVAARFSDGHFLVDTACFDGFGAELIRAGLAAPLLLMDELGFLEARCAAFQAAVHEALDAPTPVLAVLRQSAGDWLDKLRARPDAQLITVTRENRDALPGTLAAMLRALLSASA